MTDKRFELKKSMEDDNYSDETVMCYFLWVTSELEGIGGGAPSALATMQFRELVENGESNEEAFVQAYLYLKTICPICDPSHL